MKPTMELRLNEQTKREELYDACSVTGAYYPEVGATYFVLQQWWEDKNGNGEWRNVPTTYCYQMDTKDK